MADTTKNDIKTTATVGTEPAVDPATTVPAKTNEAPAQVKAEVADGKASNVATETGKTVEVSEKESPKTEQPTFVVEKEQGNVLKEEVLPSTTEQAPQPIAVALEKNAPDEAKVSAAQVIQAITDRTSPSYNFSGHKYAEDIIAEQVAKGSTGKVDENALVLFESQLMPSTKRMNIEDPNVIPIEQNHLERGRLQQLKRNLENQQSSRTLEIPEGAVGLQ